MRERIRRGKIIIVSKIPSSRINLYPSSYVGQRPEAKAVGLKEQSPYGLFLAGLANNLKICYTVAVKQDTIAMR